MIDEKLEEIVLPRILINRSQKLELIHDIKTAICEEMLGADEIYNIAMNQKYFVEGKGYIRVARLPEPSFKLATAIHKEQMKRLGVEE